MLTDLLSEVSAYVYFLLKDKLPSTLTFHNIDHTLEVVQGAREISAHCNLTDEQLETVEIAAWLHDTGYLYRYKGHEEESIRLARLFLEEKGFPSERIKEAIGCIEATRYPQTPKNLLQQIICDADFYHFSFPNYFEKAALLRIEWGRYLKKEFTDHDWNKENCHILSAHTYFTEYGQTLLEKSKDRNLGALKSFCK